MRNKRDRLPSKRRYPPFYEKAVPIALAILAALILVLLAISIAVALSLLSGRG